MARGKKKTGGTNRREFPAGARAVLTFGAVTGLTAYARSVEIKPGKIPIAARTGGDPSIAAGWSAAESSCNF